MEELKTLNKGGTNLPSHADRLKVPGVDMSTGSLGQGISAAVGIALANRMQGRDNWTYCIVGDGELNEGQVWEACEQAANLNLDRFFCFVDWNKKQLDGASNRSTSPEALKRSFGRSGSMR
jgi:transketolase